ncbi:MAG: amidinotransferase [Cyclobacteriaceae bacterium]
MKKQITDRIMMVRPSAFHMNEETAVNNYYQQPEDGVSQSQIQSQALVEFDAMVVNLRSNGINVTLFQDSKDSQTPDSIFCNNWNSFHEDGTVFLYPMFAENRRREIKSEILQQLNQEFLIRKTISLTEWESKEMFLEGTGSMILDRHNQICYASISDRTNLEVLESFCSQSNFKLVAFTSYQEAGTVRLPIYHTNVMMCLGEQFSVICLDSIDNDFEKKTVIQSLSETGKEIVKISEDQCNRFAGNMLQVRNQEGKRFVVMSESAYRSLDSDQEEKLSRHGELLFSSLDTIEKYGGGSARCMMAEIFLQPKHTL